MKKILLSILVAMVGAYAIAMPNLAYAQYTGPYEEVCNKGGGAAQESVVCQNRNNRENPLLGEEGVFRRAINILAWIIGLASIIIMVIAGLKYITSSGDPKGIESAKNTIIYAAIGIVIFLSAQAILYFVIRRL